MTIILLAQLAFVVTGLFVVGARRVSPALLAVYASSQLVFVGAFSGCCRSRSRRSSIRC